MKKMFFLTVITGTFAMSVASFASSVRRIREVGHDEVTSSVSVAGKGACRHAGCKCTWYSSAGNGGKCVCGHWDYVHN